MSFSRFPVDHDKNSMKNNLNLRPLWPKQRSNFCKKDTDVAKTFPIVRF